MGFLIYHAVTVNPIAYGRRGEGLFGLRHQAGSQNSRTLLHRVSKISDFSFMPFGHIVPKFQVNVSARGVAAVIFPTGGHEK